MGRKNKKKSKELETTLSNIKKEVIGILIIALGTLAGISIYITQNGFVMDYLNQIVTSIFGVSAYMLPIFLIIYSVVVLNNEESTFSIKPFALITVMLGFYSSCVYVFNYDNPIPVESSAGYLGDFFGMALVNVFGKLGSYVVIACSIIVLFILLTKKSVVKAVKTGVHTAMETTEKGAGFLKKTAHDYMSLDDMELPKLTKDLSKFDIHIAEEDVIPEEEEEEEEIVVKKPRKDLVIKMFGEEETRDLVERFRKKKEMPSVDLSFWENSLQDEEIEEMEEEEKPRRKRKAKQETLEEEYEENDEEEVEYVEYTFPSIKLLKNVANKGGGRKNEAKRNSALLEQTLASFGVNAKVINCTQGPTVTRYELQPESGVKVSRIVNLADDIALNLAAAGVRIEAPIPGKAAIGIEIANPEPQMVGLREAIESDEFNQAKSKLSVCLGKGIDGKPAIIDLAKMPHLLIAGATGSGKSVCINSIIASILYKSSPDEVKLLMVDPKVVELKVYNGIPHLLIPVVTDPKKAASALNWAVAEMLSRYKIFAENNVKNLAGYNEYAENNEMEKMAQIVIIIDELADLMMSCPKEVEDAICRLAQMARAAGMHLIIATQRPSVDVITGLIKANIPSRIAFAVSSAVDSRTILDLGGAEKLLGKGDMLYYPVGASKPTRIQGAYVSEDEIEKIVDFIKETCEIEYDEEVISEITSTKKNTEETGEGDGDELLKEAIELIRNKEKASISMFQRAFRIGFNRAARLMEELEDKGIVGPDEGTKPRKILLDDVDEA